jgi:hypothetical protein
MKKKAMAFLLPGIILLASFQVGCVKSMSEDELKNSIEITDVETKWVSKYYQPWPPKLILVPVISFRVKNIGQKPLKYVNFNAIFKNKGDRENLGDNFMAAIRGQGVPPGEKSPVITLKSNFGREGKNLESFANNPYWTPVEVKLFARSKGSQFILLGQWDVSKDIDFKPPEPVEIKKQ